MGTNQNDVLSWTSQDPRQSQLFSPWGVVYRFQVCIIDIAYAPMALIHLPQTETNAQGQSTTIVWRAIRANREDRVAKLEWAPGGGLGRAVIGKVRPSLRGIPHLTSSYAHIRSQNHLPMADLVRRDARMPVRFSFISISVHLRWITRIREFSMVPMVSSIGGGQALLTRTSW